MVPLRLPLRMRIFVNCEALFNQSAEAISNCLTMPPRSLNTALCVLGRVITAICAYIGYRVGLDRSRPPRAGRDSSWSRTWMALTWLLWVVTLRGMTARSWRESSAVRSTKRSNRSTPSGCAYIGRFHKAQEGERVYPRECGNECQLRFSPGV